ncbi:MAG: ABC transporter ATP-binding protein [Fusobacteriaceae bacterium]
MRDRTGGRIGKKIELNEKKISEKKYILKKILPYILDHKKVFIFLIIIAFVSNFLSILGPYLIGKGIGILKLNMLNKDFYDLGKIVFILSGIYSLSAFLNYLQNINLNKVTQKIVEEMRSKSFQKLNSFSLKYIDSNAHGNIMSIIINDIDNISSSISQIVSQIFVNMITVGITFGIMLAINPFLTFVQLLLVTFVMIFLKKFIEKSRKKMRERQKNLGELSAFIEENFLGQWEVKNFVYENKGISIFNNLSAKYKESSIKAYFFGGFNYPTLNFVGNLSYGIIVFIGTMYIFQEKLTLSQLTSFIIYVRMFNRPIANISDFYNIIQSVIVSGERYFEYLESEDIDLEEISIKEFPLEIKGDLEFKNINFSYDKNKILIENLNIKINAGETVAIVGPTGGGKTTLMNLLMRFYEIDAGEILLDGENIKNYRKKDYRRILGVVLQDVWIFKGTILENITYGNKNISQEKVEEICQAVGIHNYILSLAQGYKTFLSEEKSNFSNGQKQLLTIARAIINDPKILILDEATSGVDTRTEKKLVNAINKIIKNRTSFIIAHRLSTIKNANKILVVKDGKVIEIGDHETLLEKKGFYYEMYSEQYTR